jgi:hypothetical protein
MTVLYLPTTDDHDEEDSTIPYKIIQEIFKSRINGMEFRNDRDSQKKIS